MKAGEGDIRPLTGIKWPAAWGGLKAEIVRYVSENRSSLWRVASLDCHAVPPGITRAPKPGSPSPSAGRPSMGGAVGRVAVATFACEITEGPKITIWLRAGILPEGGRADGGRDGRRGARQTACIRSRRAGWRHPQAAICAVPADRIGSERR